MAYISSKRIKEQCKKLVANINQMYELLGMNDVEFTLTPQVGPIYILMGKNNNRSHSTEIILQFNPLDVDMSASKKILKKEAGISVIQKIGTHFTLKP